MSSYTTIDRFSGSLCEPEYTFSFQQKDVLTGCFKLFVTQQQLARTLSSVAEVSNWLFPANITVLVCSVLLDLSLPLSPPP